MKRARLTEEEIAEIEAVNREQGERMEQARRTGRPTNAERLARVREAGLAIAPAAPAVVKANVVEKSDGIVVNPTAKKPANDGGTSVRSSRWEIDDDVPIPETPALNGLSYPWGKLNVGQSFFIPEDGRKNRSKLTSMYAAHKRFKGERRFRAEWQDKDPKRGISGFRVWRVS